MDAATPGADPAPTLPRLVLRHAAERGRQVAMREKHRGIWRAWTWQEMARDARALAAGLQAQGFRRGDALVVLGDNRPRLYWAICAAQMLGGVPVVLPGETPADAVERVLAAHRVRHAVAGDARHGERLLDARADGTVLPSVIVEDPRGLEHVHGPDLVPLDRLLATGRAADDVDPAALDREIEAGLPADLAAILPYPHITLGSPDEAWSAMRPWSQTHAQAVAGATARIEAHRLGDRDELLAHLPLGCHADHHFAVALAWTGAVTVNFPESSETVPIDIRELGPTLHVLPDWALKQMRSDMIRHAKDANAIGRLLFRRYVGDDAAHAAPRQPDLLGRLLFLRPLRDLLGLHRTRVLFVDGTRAAPAGIAFFRHLDLPVDVIDGWGDGVTAGAAPGARLRPLWREAV